MRRSLLPWLVLAALAVPLGVSAATLEGVERRATAGSRLELSWHDLPAGLTEVELELSVDGGRWVRVSAEHEASEGRISWTVPDIPSGHAVLRLRAGGGLVEREVARSRPFLIDGRSRHIAPSRDESIEWWTAFDNAWGGAAAAFGPVASLSPALSAEMLEDSPGDGVPAPPPCLGTRLAPAPLASREVLCRSHPAAATFRPLRN